MNNATIEVINSLATLPIIQTESEGEWLDVLGMKIKFLCTGEDSQGRYSSMLNTIPKGVGAPPHKHPWDEAFYVLKGEVEIIVGDKRYHLYPGDYARVPAGFTHGFSGLSDEEGLVIAFESPSNSHEFFKEIHETVRTIPNDLAKMPDIGERHQVTFVK